MRILRGTLSLLLTLCASLAAEAQNLATFTGTLVRRDSTAVAMAKVKLPLLERTATTDDSGHFEIRNLPAGKHEVTVWAPGAAPVSMELVLLAGLTTLPRDPMWRNAMLSSPLEAFALYLKAWLPGDLSKRIKYD